jgi:hypothetical protein
MPKPSSISRRLHSSLSGYTNGNYEEALIHLFPAMDKTAKRRRPKAGVGDRIKGFLTDEEGFINAIATNNVIRGLIVSGISFPEAIYKFGRCPIAHEGELDPRLKISANGDLSIGAVWEIPSGYIFAMAVMVLVAPENTGESFARDIGLKLAFQDFNAADWWGKRDRLKQLYAAFWASEGAVLPADI